jgi:hypothetical protein
LATRETEMPCYQVTILRSEPTVPTRVFLFVAGSDEQAIACAPAVAGDCALEIWDGERLVAMMDAGTATIAKCDLAALAANMIERIAAERRGKRPAT